ncbi:unnamed protein product [Mytilus edulis]|uniref:C-type lectin domain-containing protein n=1 Tax=Mytilus edulis TaxID=6550 RepID=A0A8S3QXE0_MYTED|nr:unnamed protein product [Mytilus edulis]
MSSACHSAKCKRITLLNRNVQSDSENDDYDVIFPDGSDANGKKEEKANISEDIYDRHYQGLEKNRGEMNYDALQTLDKNTKDRRLVRLKVLSASLLLLSLTLIVWNLYLYFGNILTNCNKKGFSYDNCTLNENSTNSKALSKYTWYRAGFKPCHEGWVFKDKSFGCYYISDIKLAWTDANKFCRNMSSCLTNILSHEDLNWIGSLTNDHTWVGGNRNGYVYQWECQQYNYQKQISPYSALWAKGEPRLDEKTQCVQIWKLKTGFGLDDHYCNLSKRFVCKSVPIIR